MKLSTIFVMRKLLTMSALVISSLAIPPAQSSVLMIDDFNNGHTNKTLVGPATQSFSTTVNANGIIGGQRVIDFQLTEAPNESRTANLFVNAGNDTLSLSNTVESNSFVTLSYGPGLNQVLPTGGHFVFPVVNTDGVTSELNFSLNGSDPKSVIITDIGNAYIPSYLFGDVSVIDSLELGIAGETGFDIELKKITYEYPTVVNEPSALLAVIIPLTAIGLLRRKATAI